MTQMFVVARGHNRAHLQLDFHTWRTVAKWESKSQLMEETSMLFDQRGLSLLTYTQQSLTLIIRGRSRSCRHCIPAGPRLQFRVCIFFLL